MRFWLTFDHVSPLLSLREKNTHTHTGSCETSYWSCQYRLCSTNSKWESLHLVDDVHLLHQMQISKHGFTNWTNTCSTHLWTKINFEMFWSWVKFPSLRTTHLHRNPGFFVYPKSRQLLYRSEPSSHNPQVMSIQLEDGDWLHKWKIWGCWVSQFNPWKIIKLQLTQMYGK